MWIWILVACIALFFLYGYLSHYFPTTTYYDIETDGSASGYTIALLSDLHCCRYGKNYEKLISMVDATKPDFILIAGDMTVKHKSVENKKVKAVLELLRNLSAKYPVFYADGNHEPRMVQPEAYAEKLKEAGCIYLDNGSIYTEEIFKKYSKKNDSYTEENENIIKNDLAKKSNKLLIYGLNLPLYYYRENLELDVEQINGFLNKNGNWIEISSNEKEKKSYKHNDIVEKANIKEINKTKEFYIDDGSNETQSEYIILIAHDPRHAESYAAWGADLTVCGHFHGGLMRLPVVGGVIAPNFRLFPKYDAGVYDIDGKKVVVSRGLGSHHIKLRFFNRPELVVIRLK